VILRPTGAKTPIPFNRRSQTLIYVAARVVSASQQGKCATSVDLHVVQGIHLASPRGSRHGKVANDIRRRSSKKRLI
jgi:hypothetical protein